MSGDQLTQFFVDPIEAKELFDAIYRDINVEIYANNVPQGKKTIKVLKPACLYKNLCDAAHHHPATSNFMHVYNDYLASDTKEDVLIKAHAAFFSRESFLYYSVKNGAPVTTRVFPPKGINILADVDDFFRNGLAFFRAATTIARHDNNKFDQEKYNKLFHVFCQRMQAYRVTYQNAPHASDKKEVWKKANQELAKFNGALARQLVDFGVCDEFNQAKDAINLVRGYQFKLAYPERFCTIRETNSRNFTIAFYFSQPSTFSPSSAWDLDTFQEQTWYHAIKDQMGKKKSQGSQIEHDWLDKFFLANIAKLSRLSPVPMVRNTPNPSNANASTIVFFNLKGNVQQSLSWSHSAFTEPYQISDDKARRALTEMNHAQLMSDERIQGMVAYHFSKWQKMYTKVKDPVITLPYLHQTLVTDGVITSSDFLKSRTMLDNKARANQAMRNALKGKLIYVNKKNPHDVQVIPKTKIQQFNSVDYQQVELDILEVNNCINMYEKISRIRKNNIADSKKLINYALRHLQRAFPTSDHSVGVKNPTSLFDSYILWEFFTSRDYSFFTPYKSPNSRVKNAVAVMSDRLQKLDTPEARDLDVLLRSAVELKCLVHETWLGALRRRASHFVMKAPYIGPAVNFLFIDIPSNILKAAFAFMPWGWVGLAHWAKHHSTRRKTVYKSTYEMLIASVIGKGHTGCMSNVDRGLLEGTFLGDLLLQYNVNGHITRYNDNKENLMARYLDNTEDMHNANKMAVDCSGTKLSEIHNPFRSSGLPSEQEKAEDLELSKLLKHNRKGEFIETKPDAYIKRAPLTLQNSSDASIKEQLPIVLPNVNPESTLTSPNKQTRKFSLKKTPHALLPIERESESVVRKYKPAAH